MTLLEWGWYGQGVPGIAEMIDVTKHLLEDLNDEINEASTGGFTASWHYNELGEKVYELRFTAARLSSEEIFYT
jgi:hypothetical protein